MRTFGINDEWEVGKLYKLVCITDKDAFKDLPLEERKKILLESKRFAPLFTMGWKNTRISGGMSSDMYCRLKKLEHCIPQGIAYNTTLLFIESVTDTRPRGSYGDSYKQTYKRILVGEQVCWIHTKSNYPAGDYLRFRKLG